MNTKIANFIALELGILIAIMAWLAFSNLSRVKQRPVAEKPERTASSFATVTPVLKSRSQRLSAADYRVDHAEAQQEGEEQAPPVQQYEQEIAAEPDASSELVDANVIGTSPSYAAVVQEAVLYPPDCLVPPITEIVAYPQPNEIIVFSNSRSFGCRHRATPRFGGTRTMVAPRRPDEGRRLGEGKPHVRAGGVVSPRNPRPRSFRPSQVSSPHLRSLASK